MFRSFSFSFLCLLNSGYSLFGGFPFGIRACICYYQLPPTPFLPFPCQSTRRSVLCCAPSPVRACRKRSISESSDSSSDGSNSGSRHHHKKSSRSRKLTEVERLAEMERQRRQKEAEQKVSFLLFGFSMTLWSLFSLLLMNHFIRLF